MHLLTCSAIDQHRRRFLLVHSSLSYILRQLNASGINVFWIRSSSMPTTWGAQLVHCAWKPKESRLAWRKKPQETSDRPWRRKASYNQNVYNAYASWRDVKLRRLTKTQWQNCHEPPYWPKLLQGLIWIPNSFHGQQSATSAWVRGWYRYFLSLRNPRRRPRALAARCGCAQCFLGSANAHMKLTDRGWKEAFVFRVVLVDVSFSSLSNRARAD